MNAPLNGNHYHLVVVTFTSVDPGFPRGGTVGAKPKGGAPTYYLAKFGQKLHENEENWTEGDAFKILLCRSATVYVSAPAPFSSEKSWDV